MQRSSELIKNDDGSVYHLNIDKSFLREWIITVGDPERISLVEKYCDGVIMSSSKREFTCKVLRLGKEEIMVISTGIGTDNIDIVWNELHALWLESGWQEPLNFVRLGTSGSLREGIPVDSILVSKAALGLDLLLHYYAQNTPDKLGRELHSLKEELSLPLAPYYAPASEELFEKFMQIPHAVEGLTVTAPGFYAPQGRDLFGKMNPDLNLDGLAGMEIASQKVSNFEMETSGIYGMSELLGHRAVSVSAILANRSRKEFSANPSATVSRMVEAAIGLIGGALQNPQGL